MIKYDNYTISDWYNGSDNIVKVYRGVTSGVGNVVYQKVINGDTPTPPTPTHDYYKQYFTLATDDGTSGTFYIPNLNSLSLQYSTDSGSTWSQATTQTGITVVSSSLMLKGLNSKGWSSGAESTSKAITANTDFHAEGNIMSLWYGDDFSGQTTLIYNCLSLFNGSSHLTSVENLKFPARTINSYCYHTVFKNCSNLSGSVTFECDNTDTEAFSITFENCSKLTKVSFPNLTGITGSQCMYYTFNGCTSLEELEMPSLINFAVYSNTYNNLRSLNKFINTATSGTNFSYGGQISQNCTFYKNPNANWTGLPSAWTVVDY